MIVTFYKTKLSANNRCYDGAAYENYLNSIKAEDKKAVTLEYDIIPNSNFYLPLVSADNQWQLYNYITFEYAGLKYGSFILSIQPLATDGTIEVRHTTDNWYYVKVNNLNIDFHGQCIRAHVNDFAYLGNSSFGAPLFGTLMQNTLMKPEEQVSSSCYNINSDNILPIKTVDSKQYRYIYVYINSPKQSGITTSGVKQYMLNYYGEITSSGEPDLDSKKIIPLYGLLMVGIVDTDGDICFYTGSTDISDFSPYKTSLIKMQSDAITKIAICDIPPSETTSIEFGNDGTPYIKDTSSPLLLRNVTFDATMQSQGFPQKADTCALLTPKTINKTSINDTKITSFYTDRYAFSGLIPNTYEKYYEKGIAKLKSPAYNVIRIFDKLLDFSKCDFTSNIKLQLQLTPDLYNIYTNILDISNINGRQYFSVQQFISCFDTNVKKSYFNIADMALAGLNANKKITNASFDVANASIGTVSSFASGMANPTKLVSGITGTVQGGVNTARAVSNLNYTKNIENITLNKTYGQINNGDINTNTPVGYYSSVAKLEFDNIELVSPTSEGYRQLFALLHKYGYNTILPLEEVYVSHKRENFNYIQTEYCDVNGVPLDIANDIEEMFNSGVHLWNGEVEKWDVPNWQDNLKQYYYIPSDTEVVN